MTTHTGGCHCGKIAYSFEGDIDTVLDCNCSLCQKRCGLLHFIPETSFALKTPRADMGSYQFNKHKLTQHFCTVCGVAPFSEGKGGDGSAMTMVNVRCLEGVDLAALKILPFDGASY